MIVVDCSVIVGWVVAVDAYHDLAVATRHKDPAWHAPFLYRSEFRSVAAGYLRKGELLETLLAAGALAVQGVEAHQVTDAEVFSVLKASPVSAYDAEYIALARRLACPLVTTDQVVLRQWPGLAIRLSDFAE
jgi:predicted nucleic acid-binding protein